jgi:hypothetical protein
LGLAFQGTWSIDLDASTYDLGGLVRHEVGHMVHFAVHDRSQNWGCNSDALANVAGRKATSCEWGYQAMLEGLPTFFAVRSITSNDTNVWFCQCADAANQDQCSEVASGASGFDNDRIQGCPDGEAWGWRGIGDAFAFSRDQCTRVRKVEGCSVFTDTNQNGVWNEGETQYCSSSSGGVCTDYWKHGHRNTVQVVRFFWDVLDASNEAPLESYGHIDDTTLAMDGAGGLVSVFESMPCPGTGEGHCSEPSWQAPTCYPASATASGTWWPMGFTRDSYNPYDFGQLIAGVDEGSATSELQLNCMGWAGD